MTRGPEEVFYRIQEMQAPNRELRLGYPQYLAAVYQSLYQAGLEPPIEATRFEKLAVIGRHLASFQDRRAHFPFIETIHNFGPYPEGITEFLRYVSDILTLSRVSPTGGPTTFHDSKIYSPDPEKTKRAAGPVEEASEDFFEDLKTLAGFIIELPTTSKVVDVAYSICLDRSEYNPSRNLRDSREALSPIVLTSLARNLWYIENSIRTERRRDPAVPKGEGVLPFDEAILDWGDGIECLKEGTINVLVAYLAVCTLHSRGYITGRNHKHLTRLLAWRKLNRDLKYRQARGVLQRSQLDFERLIELLHDGETEAEEYVSGSDRGKKALEFLKSRGQIRFNTESLVATLAKRMQDLDLVRKEGSNLVPLVKTIRVARGEIIEIEHYVEKIDTKIRKIDELRSWLKRERPA